MCKRNPFYLLSAFCMLLGTYLLIDPASIQANDLSRIIPLYIALQIYEFALIGIFINLFRRGAILSDCLQLLFIECLFFLDIITTHTEFTAIDFRFGIIMNAISLVLVVVKLNLILSTLKVKLDRTFLAFISVGIGYLYLFIWFIVMFRQNLESYSSIWFLTTFIVVIQVHIFSRWLRLNHSYQTELEEKHKLSIRRVFEVYAILQIVLSSIHIFAFGYIFRFTQNISWLAPIWVSLIVLVGEDRFLRKIRFSTGYETRKRNFGKETIPITTVNIDTSLKTFSFKLNMSAFVDLKDKSFEERHEYEFQPIYLILIVGLFLAMLPLHADFMFFGVLLTPLRISLLYGAVLLFWTYGKRHKLLDVLFAVTMLTLAFGGGYPMQIVRAITHPSFFYMGLLAFNAGLYLLTYFSFTTLLIYCIAFGILCRHHPGLEHLLSFPQVVHLVLIGIGFSAQLLKQPARHGFRIGIAALLVLDQLFQGAFTFSWLVLLDYVAIVGWSFLDKLYWLNWFLLLPLLHYLPSIMQSVFRLLDHGGRGILNFMKAILTALIPSTRGGWGKLLVLVAFVSLYLGFRRSISSLLKGKALKKSDDRSA